MAHGVTRTGQFDAQVCVPGYWSDTDVLNYANAASPTGAATGWKIRKAGDPALLGEPERTHCDESSTHVHIMLDC